MAEVTWFKVLTDIFADDKIKILQSMPEGDALLVMWFKVLSQAGKTNDGGYIYLKKNIPYTSSMLSTLFNKNQLLVDLAIRTFSEFGMIDIDDKGYIFVTNWEKHQSIDKLNQIKEQTRIRTANYREKKKLELLGCDATVTSQVTQGDAIEVEVDLELEKDTTTTGTEFTDLENAYCELHRKMPAHLSAKEIMDMQKLLNKKIPINHIIKTMKQAYSRKMELNEKVTNFTYYTGMIIDSWENRNNSGIRVVPDRPKTRDPDLISRDIEIARVKWEKEGNDPNEFSIPTGT